MTTPRRRPSPAHRSAARLGAVQALYQMDLAGSDVGETLAQFSSRTAGDAFDEGQCGEADYKLLTAIVQGTVREQLLLDPFIEKKLDAEWPLHRLDSTIRAILRAAAFELAFMETVPARVVIAEYMAVTSAFFEGDEPRFVNGVLDGMARQRRPQEFSA